MQNNIHWRLRCSFGEVFFLPDLHYDWYLFIRTYTQTHTHANTHTCSMLQTSCVTSNSLFYWELCCRCRCCCCFRRCCCVKWHLVSIKMCLHSCSYKLSAFEDLTLLGQCICVYFLGVFYHPPSHSHTAVFGGNLKCLAAMQRALPLALSFFPHLLPLGITQAATLIGWGSLLGD